MTVARINIAGGCSDGDRGLTAGGEVAGTNVIDYVTIATTGNATDFGDLTVSRGRTADCSDGTRALFGGGYNKTNVIDYVTVQTIGNATDFGDLTSNKDSMASCSGD